MFPPLLFELFDISISSFLGRGAHWAAAAAFFFIVVVYILRVCALYVRRSESELCCQLTDYYSMGLPRSVTKVALVGRTTIGFDGYYLALSRLGY